MPVKTPPSAMRGTRGLDIFALTSSHRHHHRKDHQQAGTLLVEGEGLNFGLNSRFGNCENPTPSPSAMYATGLLDNCAYHHCDHQHKVYSTWQQWNISLPKDHNCWIHQLVNTGHHNCYCTTISDATQSLQ